MSVSIDKRIPVPSIPILQNEIQFKHDKLKTLINEYNLVNNEQYHDFSVSLKECFADYSHANYELVNRLLNVGSTEEAKTLRNERLTLRADVNELIRIINAENLQSNADSESLVADSELRSNYSDDLYHESLNGDPSEFINQSKNSIPTRVVTFENLSLSNPISSIAPFSTGSFANNFTKNISNMSISTPLSFNPIFNKTSNFSNVNATNSVHPHSYGKPGPTPQLFSNVGNSHYSNSKLPVSTNVSNASIPNYGSYMNTSYPYTAPRVNAAPPMNAPHAPYFTVGSQASMQPPSIPGPYAQNIPMPYFDPYNAKQQTTSQKTGKPFSGDPHEYHSWVNLMNSRMRNPHLDSWDILTVLHTNSTGKPQKLIEQHMAIGGIDPDQTLRNVWSALHQRFGKSIKIANSLIAKVEQFPTIKDASNSDQLYELYSLCQLILCNINASPELQTFHNSLGLRQVWLKLPFSFQNTWREIASHFTETNGFHPPFNKFVEFLEKKCNENTDDNYYRPTVSAKVKIVKDAKTFKVSTDNTHSKLESSKEFNCLIHENGKHNLSECKVFAKQTHSEKREYLLNNKRCFKCLGPHLKSDCKTEVSCSICNERHATAMHRNNYNNSAPKPSTETTKPNESKPNALSQFSRSDSNLCVQVCKQQMPSKSCSKTLLVDVTLPSKSNKTLRCYCIIDEQSSSTFVHSDLVNFFELSFPMEEYTLTTLTGLRISTSGMLVEGLVVKGVKERRGIFLPPALTNDFIPNSKNEIATPDIVSAHKHVSYLAKNFNEVNNGCDVYILVGRDCGAAMATKCFGYKAPYAHRTPLGWALVGSACLDNQNLNKSATVLKANINLESMNATRRFLETREGIKPLVQDIFAERDDDELQGPSKEDSKFLAILSHGIDLDDHNNIVMPLPFKSVDPMLPCNRSSVYYRTSNTLNRLKKDQSQLNDCLAAMHKYIENDHVEQVPTSELTTFNEGKRWYVPVFPVKHPKKLKTRLVFDSSAVFQKTSLNKELLSGPDMNNHLRTVLMRFRNGEIGFSADVESMFYAFRLRPEDRDFTRFFWYCKNDPSQQLVEYRAKVHIFGNTSSPALANIGLRYAAVNAEQTDSSVTEFVFRHFYVDDACGCADSEEEAINILTKTRAALTHFNIRLHKITASSSKITEHFPESERVSTPTKDFADSTVQHALGIQWNVSTDHLCIRCNIPDRPFTKRGILATINTVFDPLGFVSPLLLTGRILQRNLIPSKEDNSTLASLGWDDPLPSRLRESWENWKTSLIAADGKISLPRGYYPRNFSPVVKQSLHVFSDASEEGTGYIIYIRSINERDEIHVALVTASSRVTPRSAISIPRLELCAALDASLAARQVAANVGIDLSDTFLYCDSKVTLGYLANTTSRFSNYVTRRVNLILKSFPISHWLYIPTGENPADIASRGHTCDSLLQTCWFRGPRFLWNKDPSPSTTFEVVDLPEILPSKVTLKTDLLPSNSSLNCLFESLSSWKRILLAIKFVIEFVTKLSELAALKRGVHLARSPKVSLSTAEKFAHLCIQNEAFQLQIRNLKCSVPLPKSDCLVKFSPFLDEQGIVRVGGRLHNSDLPFYIKFPIIIPSSHPSAVLLVRHFHEATKHQGRVITMGAVRSAGYYILHGSSVIKKTLKSCVTCIKMRGNFESQMMSNLPSDRLHEEPPFTYCGMDVFGPYEVTDGKSTRRNTPCKKTWGIVFTCLVSKAVHIEPLPHLDISSFKNALRRFFCLRGTSRLLRSDQGTNFIGARGQDASISQEDIQAEMDSHNVEWQLNPPKASHFGGIWERKIRSIKEILETSLRQLGPRGLSRDELHTFFAESASIINNTPLWDVSNCPDDPFPLTPAMLLHSRTNPNPPPLEKFTQEDILSYGPRRWRRVQALTEQFWSRWRDHYLHQLQIRQKWIYPKRSLQHGDIVLMKDKSVKRSLWPLARVVDTKVSNDGLVRSVTLKTHSRSNEKERIFVRPVTDVILVLGNVT